MKHRVVGRKLGRTSAHRLALLRNLSTSLFEKERIKTTLMKAKELRPFAERLLTLSKRETLHARRQVLRRDLQCRSRRPGRGLRGSRRPVSPVRSRHEGRQRSHRPVRRLLELPSMPGAPLVAGTPRPAPPAIRAILSLFRA